MASRRKARRQRHACASEQLERRLLLSAAAIGPEFAGNTFITGAQAAPALAVDGDGDFVLAWQSNGQDGDGYGVYAQRFGAPGQQLPPPAGVPKGQGNEFRVNVTTAGTQSQPTIAMDAAGDFVIAWTGPGPSGSNTVIYAQRYDAAGKPQGEFQVNTAPGDGAATQPAVAMDAEGDVVIAWAGGNAADAAGIFAHRYDAFDRPLGPEFMVNVDPAGLQSTASVGIDARGNFVVAWSDLNLTLPNPRLVFARRFNAAGTPQGGEFQVNSFAGISEIPSVAVDTAGDFVVAWESLGQDASNSLGVYAKRYNAAGQEQAPPAGVTLGAGNEFRVNTTTADQQRTPRVAMDGRGDFVVTWATKGQDGAPASYGIYARQYTAAGSPIAGEFKVNTTVAGDQKSPAVGMDLDGNFVAAWQGPDANSTGIFAQRYDESTDSAGPAVGPVTSGGVPVTPSATLAQSVSQFNAAFSGNLDTAGGPAGGNSVTNPANWALSYNGQDFSSRITAVTFALNASTNRFEANLTISPALMFDGNYVLTAKQAIRDPAGNALDGNLDGAAGGDFALPFVIRQPVRLGSESPVNVTTPGLQALPTVAMDAGGDYVVVWEGNGPGDNFGIFARRFSAAGVPQKGETLVNTTTAGNQLEPSVAMDAAGDFVVAWMSNDGSDYGIFAKRFNAAGVAQQAPGAPSGVTEFQVNTTTAQRQRLGNGSVGMDAAGDFVIAWGSLGQDGSDYGTYVRRYSAAGAPLTGEVQVNSTTAGRQSTPSVAMDAGGEFVVAWQSRPQDNADGSYGIYAQRFNASGVALPAPGVAAGATEFAVNTTSAGDQFGPSVKMDAGGDFVIAWNGGGQDGGGLGVFARRFNAAGVAQQVPGAAAGATEFQVNTTTTSDQRDPSVAMDASGDFVVSWTSKGQDNADGNYGVYLRRFNAAGLGVSGELRANDTTANSQGSPSVGMDVAGDFVVAWASYGQDTPTSDGVYTARYGANQAPTTLGIAGVNAVENGAPTVIDLTASFTDSTDASSALSYSVVGDTNAALFSATPIDGSGKLTLNYATGHSGQATLTIRATDTGGLSVDTSFNVTVIGNGPVLNAITVNDGSAQRSQVKSLTLSFDRAVTLAAGAATLQRLNTGGSGTNDNSAPTDASSALTTPTSPDGGKTWVYTFAGSSSFVQKTPGNVSTGSLIDGIYELNIDPAKVTAGGSPMAAAATLTFHRLFGDVNGNKTVNTADFGFFRNAFSKSTGQGAFDPAFDFDNNGTINTADFGQFRTRFGKAFTY